MGTTADRTLPYQIKMPANQAAAELHVGWRSYPVKVVDISWDAITIALPISTAKRIRLNTQAIVWHHGTQWRTVINQCVREENGRTLLSMSLSDYDDPRLKKHRKSAKYQNTICGEQSVNSDPLTLAVLVFGFLIVFLFVLGGGNESGQAGSFNLAVEEFCRQVMDFLSGLFR